MAWNQVSARLRAAGTARSAQRAARQSADAAAAAAAAAEAEYRSTARLPAPRG